MAATRKQAMQAFRRYGAKYPKDTAKLENDREALLAVFAFPAKHWVHRRTTNPIESTFATAPAEPRTASPAPPSSFWPSR